MVESGGEARQDVKELLITRAASRMGVKFLLGYYDYNAVHKGIRLPSGVVNGENTSQ